MTKISQLTAFALVWVSPRAQVLWIGGVMVARRAADLILAAA
jgi:hypothetical protein